MLRPTLAALGIAALIGMAPNGASIADSRVPFALEVENAAAKVGEPTAVRATIRSARGHEAHERLSPPRHRSLGIRGSWRRVRDEVVIGTVEDGGSLVFEIGVTPTEPGAHPINGVMRVSFINGNKSEDPRPSP